MFIMFGNTCLEVAEVAWFVIYAEPGDEGVEIWYDEVDSLKEVDEEKAVFIYKKEEVGDETIGLMKALVDAAKQGVGFQKVRVELVPKD